MSTDSFWPEMYLFVQERREKFREEWAKGNGEFHHGGNHTNGRINNVTLAQVVQPSFAKEKKRIVCLGVLEKILSIVLMLMES